MNIMHTFFFIGLLRTIKNIYSIYSMQGRFANYCLMVKYI